jgi:hypothetical protein
LPGDESGREAGGHLKPGLAAKAAKNAKKNHQINCQLFVIRIYNKLIRWESRQVAMLEITNPEIFRF